MRLGARDLLDAMQRANRGPKGPCLEIDPRALEQAHMALVAEQGELLADPEFLGRIRAELEERRATDALYIDDADVLMGPVTDAEVYRQAIGMAIGGSFYYGLNVMGYLREDEHT